MKALLYIRVSTNRQVDEGYSLDEQEKALIRFAMQKGYEVPDEYLIRENGRSGRHVKTRPGFQKVLEIVENKGCDAVIVHSLSRFARSVKDTIVAIEKMKEKGVEFISLKEEIDTRTANGKLFLNILASFAQFYSDQLSDRITEAHRYAEERGGKLGQEPFGFKRDKDKMLVEDEREQKIIRMVRGLNKKGWTYQEICDTLMERNVANKAGNVKWFPSQIQKMVN